MAGAIETRSIDWIPTGERRGKVHHQAPFWFTGNFVLTTMVTGFLGPANGLSAGWSVLAAVAGACFGTLFMCFHANQGPSMGLPQMIQSRAQFGSRGALVPFVAVIFVYIGFNLFNTILATSGFKTVFAGPNWLWYLGLMVAAIVIAVVGFDLMMVVQRWLTYLLIVVFGVLTVYALSTLHLNAAVPDGGKFSLTVFLMQFAAAAGYQISYAVYVSDYSRYLPENTSAKHVIWWTYLGAAGSSVWLMSLGAVLASIALVTIMSVNAYGASLTSMSALDAFRPITPTVRLRVLGIALTSLVAFVVALSLPEGYLESFNTFVLLMLYFLIPWTAVNLVDFYFVRRGHYSIVDIFRPDGIYGRWSWRGLAAYFLGMAAMVPFISLHFYVGPIAKLLGGVDISFLVGLAVSGVAYYVLTRDVDLSDEHAAVERSRQELTAA
ncbi:cytosine permease [Mycolicibacterium sp. NCC-Tsukiji]|jgi:purine-cytosine permease-like protein|uniref:purine-cytosine permease family protein n=1 Tax=Mycolicibacterium sp. NCC-Tsukiji TaxID=2185272 RepID=UPI00107F54BA|nr:cytosine permease [Mycolicibacterium sp. NCC-Tsukiji]